MAPIEIRKLPVGSDGNENSTFGISSHSHPRFEQDIGPWLSLENLFFVCIVRFQEAPADPRHVIACENNYGSLGHRESLFQSVADERRWVTGRGDDFFPFHWRKVD